MVATRKNRRSLAQVVANLSVPKTRRVMVKNKKYLVAPLTLIVPGVLNGSDGPLFYPPEQISASCKDWEGMPLVANHPKKDGRYVSANTDGVLRKAGLGVVRNPRVTDSGKLVAEGWFDVAKCNKVDPRILYNVRNGKPVELSTGLFTQNKAAYGVYNKKAFNAIATDYIPDHVAILMDERGACSLDDGCGVLVNKRLTCNCKGDKMCKACAAKAKKKKKKGNGRTVRKPVEFVLNSFEEVDMISANNCGTGSGGFKSGNKCAKGGRRSVGGRVGGFLAGSLLGSLGPLGGASYGLATRRRKNARRAARGEAPESRTRAAVRGAAAGFFGPAGLGFYGAVHNSECLKVGGLLPPNDFL